MLAAVGLAVLADDVDGQVSAVDDLDPLALGPRSDFSGLTVLLRTLFSAEREGRGG